MHTQTADFPDIKVIFEDEHLVVVDKPSGIAVNKAKTIKSQTVQDWWEARLSGQSSTQLSSSYLLPLDFDPSYGTPEEIFQQRGGVVHRLDKDTSGVMILAKNPGVLMQLLSKFRQREVHKTYSCLVHGQFKIPQDTLSLPLARDLHNRVRFAVDPAGREAQTSYKVEEYFPGFEFEQIVQLTKLTKPLALKKKFHDFIRLNTGFSLVSCYPKTGRTHQIRVHMSHLGHPIVSDVTYLGKKRKELDLLWCPRLFLHAAQIELTHPTTGQSLKVVAPLSPDLMATFKYLKHD